jgi:hypothetical protein
MPAENRGLAVVLDPENSDPTWGTVEGAVFWNTVNGELEQDPDVPPSDQIPIYSLIEACRKLIDSSDHTGCTPNLCVVESAPVHEIRKMLKLIGE